MVPIILILIISIFILLLIIIFALIHIRGNPKSKFICETQRLIYSTKPSIDIVTRPLEYPSDSSNQNLLPTTQLDKPKPNESRSHSIANNLFITTCSNRRRSSIVDSKQIAQIQFSLPPTAEKLRRRSVAICNNIIESKPSTIDSIIQTIKSSNQFLPCLASFSMVYCNESSEIKIGFHSLRSLPLSIKLQQLTIQVKLIPDGKVKCISIKDIINNENIFSQDDNEYIIQFSNVSLAKLYSKAILIKFYGKNEMKKTIQLGQIGKIRLNQINNLDYGNSLSFVHEIEMIKIVRLKPDKYFVSI